MPFLFMLVLGFGGSISFKPEIRFVDPSTTSDEFLGYPYDMDFDHSGKLYVVDQDNHRILVWNADGSFDRGFGSLGQAPGQFSRPFSLKVSNGEIHVFDHRGVMTVFGLDGQYRRAFQLVEELRTFAPIGPDHYVLCFEQAKDPDNVVISFVLADKDGREIRELKRYPKHLNVGKGEGGQQLIRPFAGQEVLFADRNGQWYMGYGSEPVLYSLSPTGDITKSYQLGLQTTAPDQDKMTVYRSMSFPAGNGERIAVKDLPNLSSKEGLDMGYFSQMTLVNGKVLAALTPIGGSKGIGAGFARGYFQVADLFTGKIQGSGEFKYPQDSVVLFNSGRTVVFNFTEEGEYKIETMTW